MRHIWTCLGLFHEVDCLVDTLHLNESVNLLQRYLAGKDNSILLSFDSVGPQLNLKFLSWYLPPYWFFTICFDLCFFFGKRIIFLRLQFGTKFQMQLWANQIVVWKYLYKTTTFTFIMVICRHNIAVETACRIKTLWVTRMCDLCL